VAAKNEASAPVAAKNEASAPVAAKNEASAPVEPQTRFLIDRALEAGRSGSMGSGNDSLEATLRETIFHLKRVAELIESSGNNLAVKNKAPAAPTHAKKPCKTPQTKAAKVKMGHFKLKDGLELFKGHTGKKGLKKGGAAKPGPSVV
jgi:hypothetical protein